MRIDVVTALAPDIRGPIRQLLDRAFEGDFSDADWRHALGGSHALVYEGATLVAHAAVVPRRMWVGEREVAAGYVEAVAVSPERQRRGLGTAAMRALVPALRLTDLGVLSTGEHRFYEGLGWERWQGTTWVRGPTGTVRTEDEDDGILILRTPQTGPLDLAATLTCPTREGDDW